MYSWFSHQKWWFSIAMWVYQRVVHVSSPSTLQHEPLSHRLQDPGGSAGPEPKKWPKPQQGRPASGVKQRNDIRSIFHTSPTTDLSKHRIPEPSVSDSNGLWFTLLFFFYQDGQFGYSPYFVFQSRNCFVGPFFGRGLKCILEEILDAHLVHGTGARFSDRDFSWYLKDSMIHILGILWKTISNCGWYCFELINLNPWRILKWFRL